MAKRVNLFLMICVCLAVLLLTTACNEKPTHTHNYSEEAVVQPTCTEKGYTKHICSCGEYTTDNEVPALGHVVPSKKKITDWGKNMEYLCTRCNSTGLESINGVLSLKDPEQKDGYTFIGWKIGETVYASNQSISVFGGEEVSPVYDNSGSHVCAYVKSDKSTEPSCSVIGQYHLTCSCGKSVDVTLPAHGHMWTDWSRSEGSDLYERKCEVCDFKETKKLLTDEDKNGNLYAFGDSITFGQKVGGVNGSYAKFVSEGLGMNYVNNALSGSEVYQWYSLLTGKAAPNGKMTDKINGLTKDSFTSKLQSADVIVFSLGTNDIFYTEWRPVAKISETITKLIDAIHQLNPEAKIILVGGAYSEQFWDGGTYEKDQERIYQLTDSLTKSLSSEDYNDFAFFVDITRILSDHNSYTDVSYGDPDGIHPGFKANEYISEFVLDSILSK